MRSIYPRLLRSGLKWIHSRWFLVEGTSHANNCKVDVGGGSEMIGVNDAPAVSKMYTCHEFFKSIIH